MGDRAAAVVRVVVTESVRREAKASLRMYACATRVICAVCVSREWCSCETLLLAPYGGTNGNGNWCHGKAVPSLLIAVATYRCCPIVSCLPKPLLC